MAKRATGSGKKHDEYDVLLDALGNTTKMSILLLLSRRKKLTVTDMAKYIKVTRSNLYHFVGEMVKDGMLSEPEVVVKKNHVEKYYFQNPEFWKVIDATAQTRRIKDLLTKDEGRKLLRSAFISLSLQYRIYADEIANASDAEMERIASEFERDRLMVSVWGVSDDEYEMMVSSIRQLLDDVLVESNKHPERRGMPGFNSIYITCLPRIFDSDA